MPLSPSVVQDICKMGQGNNCCRYLIVDPGIGFTCAKLTSLRVTIDIRANNNQMTAISDNCDGYKEE
jgi:hypothetical protein